VKSELYALTHRGNAGDVAFYGEMCKGAKRVLELGAGSGRLLAALADAKRLLVGLELDRELYRLAKRNLRALPEPKRRAVRVLQADMRAFALPQRFDRVLLPYNALYCLLGRRAALACFRAARRALEPGGTFILDVWNAEPFQRMDEATAADDLEPIVSLRYAGRTWDVFERSRVRRVQQRLDVSYTYVPREGGKSVQIPIAQRYFLPSEVSDLLQRAGFTIAARYGDFSRRRFGARSAQLIVVARAI
jgi:SAM-dependent methyltransferase